MIRDSVVQKLKDKGLDVENLNHKPIVVESSRESICNSHHEFRKKASPS